MRPLAAFALLACAGPAAAGPLDALQYRATFHIDRPPGPGPGVGVNETAYPLGAAPLFGITARGTPEWMDTYPAYPSAGFALLYAGALGAYVVGDGSALARGEAPFRFDLELRDTAGHTGTASFVGVADAGWNGGFGFVSPLRSNPTPPQPLVLGDTRYDVQLSYDSALIFYSQAPGGAFYLPTRLDFLPTPHSDGEYTSRFGGFIYATVTPTPEPVGTPEPGTLALAAAGLGGLLAARLRRAAA